MVDLSQAASCSLEDYREYLRLLAGLQLHPHCVNSTRRISSSKRS